MNEQPPPCSTKRKCQEIVMDVQPLVKKLSARDDKQNSSVQFNVVNTHDGYGISEPRKTTMSSITVADATTILDSSNEAPSGSSKIICDINCEPEETIVFVECSRSPSPEELSSTLSWSSDPFFMRDIKFRDERKIMVHLPSHPCEIFRLILNDDLLDLIVRETNNNAENMLLKDQTPGTRILSWYPLNRHELITFLGLVLHMGTIQQSRITDYWKRHYLYNTPCFGRLMKRSRFLNILTCLSFSSKLETSPVIDYTHNEAGEIITGKSIIDNFNETMKTLYSPGRDLLIDESLVLWNSKIYFRDDIKARSLPGGARLRVLGDTEGVAMKIRLCGGPVAEKCAKDPPEKVVLSLLEGKLGLGHSVYMGYKFNSYELAANLLEHNTLCTGTLKKNSKDLPKELVNTELKPGDNKSFFLNGVHVGQWMQKNPITYISTEFGEVSDAFYTKTSQIVLQPSAVVKYRKVMSKANLQDLMLSYYPLKHHRLRWHKKLFIHILQMSLNNAYLLYTINCPKSAKKSFYQFREAILETMLPCPPVMTRILGQQHSLTKITNFRFREKTRPSGTSVIRECMRKECKGCRVLKKKTNSMYECKGCVDSPGYCVECFFTAHGYCEVRTST